MHKSNFLGFLFIVLIVGFIFAASAAFSSVLARDAAGGFPAFPHDPGQYLVSECISCHVRGLRAAPLFDHPDRESCLSCHTP